MITAKAVKSSVKLSKDHRLFTTPESKTEVWLANYHTLNERTPLTMEYTTIAGPDIGRALILHVDSMVPWFGTVTLKQE